MLKVGIYYVKINVANAEVNHTVDCVCATAAYTYYFNFRCCLQLVILWHCLHLRLTKYFL